MEQTLKSHSVPQVDDLVENVCWSLVSSASIARIAFVADDEAQIVPVNIALVGHTVLFRTETGSRLHGLGDGSRVVVEVDHVDDTTHTGWSVIIRGVAEWIDQDLLPLIGNSVHPWASGDKDSWLWVRPEQITGRAISRPPPRPRGRLLYMAPE